MKFAEQAKALAGCRVVERSHTVACAYAGRLLAALGAEVVLIEDAEGSPLRQGSPMLKGESETSALFAYLGAGKRSLVCDLGTHTGRLALHAELANADIFIEDAPLSERVAQGLEPSVIAEQNAKLVHVSVLPFGATGPKAAWQAEEINLLHAGGEGYLLPNGLSHELFPDRPPLKIYGHFASYQGGCAAAFAALSGLWARDLVGGQYIDVSTQDAVVSVGAFALQRLGDGSLEHRSTRRFRYGGVFRTTDGYVELLTLEDRQWRALVELLGNPSWTVDEALHDPLERSRRGDEINAHIREWMASRRAEDVVVKAQELGVPVAKYRSPDEVLNGDHERARGLFVKGDLPGGGQVDVLYAPFHFGCNELASSVRVPELDELGRSRRA